MTKSKTAKTTPSRDTCQWKRLNYTDLAVHLNFNSFLKLYRHDFDCIKKNFYKNKKINESR